MGCYACRSTIYNLYAFSCYFSFFFAFARALAFAPSLLPCRTRRIICIHLRQNSCVFVTAAARNSMPFLDGRCGTVTIRKWARSVHPALGLCPIVHTLAHSIHMSHKSGGMSGWEWKTEQDGFVSSSEPSATQNAQIRAWEQRTDHPRFQRSLCSNRLFLTPFALHPSSFPTTTTTPHKLTHLPHFAKLSLKWLVLRYVHHPQ